MLTHHAASRAADHPHHRPTARGRALVADAAALAITGALSAAMLLGAAGTFRTVLAVAFVSYVPGRAIVSNWPSGAARSHVALPVVLSLSIVSVVAVIGLWVHAWAPLAQFAAEAGVSVVAIVVGLLRRTQAGRRRRRVRRAVVRVRWRAGQRPASHERR